MSHRRLADNYKSRQILTSGNKMTNRSEWKQIGHAWRQAMTNGGKRRQIITSGWNMVANRWPIETNNDELETNETAAGIGGSRRWPIGIKIRGLFNYSKFCLDGYFSGWYIYAETSQPRAPGDRSVLLSPRLMGPYCLRMHFHMMGQDIGSLNVYKITGSSKTTVLTTSGNKGDQWYMAQSSLTGSEQFQVIKNSLFNKTL